LEYRKDLRSAEDPNFDGVAAVLRGEDPMVRKARLQPGALNVFRGVNTLHRVVQVKGPVERLVAIFAFFDRPDVMMTAKEQQGFLRAVGCGRLMEGVIAPWPPAHENDPRRGAVRGLGRRCFGISLSGG